MAPYLRCLTLTEADFVLKFMKENVKITQGAYPSLQGLETGFLLADDSQGFDRKSS